MTSRGRALGIGLVVAAAYLILASVSGALSPLARLPLLDGFGTPQPYNWVSPPPALAGSNKQPSGTRATLRMTPKGSNAGFVSTGDAQATLILGVGAFPTSPGQTGVTVTVQPLDPGTLGRAPSGLTISGNAYLAHATYVPGGAPASLAESSVTVLLVYPSASSLGIVPPPRTALRSATGRTWDRLKTHDNTSALTVAGETHDLGYFAVAIPASSVPARGASRLPLILILSGVLLVGLLGLGLLLRSRRTRRGEASTRAGQPPREHSSPTAKRRRRRSR
jgi:hypothetical protein